MIAPATLGRYQLLERIGAGGMGEVYLARETGVAGFRRHVAIKRLLPGDGDREELTERFLDEARIAAQLAHPNIVAIHELGRADDGFFLVIEYVDGLSLAGVLAALARRGERMPAAVGAHVVAELARALAHAHGARDVDGAPLGVVHRDVSPHNVLVSRAGEVKLTDFGIARAEHKLWRTQTGAVQGKLAYMAPEQLAGERVDARADVFAAGVMLWELTMGRAVFAPAEALARAAGGAAVPPPTSIDPAYPPALEAIVMAAVAGDRDARTATAGALAAALDRYLDAAGPRIRREQVAALVPARSSPAIASPRADTLDARPPPPEAAIVEARGDRPSTPRPVRGSAWRRAGALLVVAIAGGGVAVAALARDDGTRPPAADPITAMAGDASVATAGAAPIDAAPIDAAPADAALVVTAPTDAALAIDASAPIASAPRAAVRTVQVRVTTASAFDDVRAIERKLRSIRTALARCTDDRTPAVLALALKVDPSTGTPTGGIESTWPYDLRARPSTALVPCIASAVKRVSLGPAQRELGSPYVRVIVELTVAPSVPVR